MNYNRLSPEDLKKLISETVARFFGVKLEEASKNQIYQAVCIVVRDMLTKTRVDFKKRVRDDKTSKHVYYMSMEFLLGRSLKNHLFNMGIADKMTKVVSDLGFDIDDLYAIEPDAGLGNGGLGRLAAAYLDSLTSLGYVASGFSIMYDYGIFKQKIVDGIQLEQPDDWLTNGSVWLQPRVEDTFEVHFGGVVKEYWNNGGMVVEHKDYTTILAVPYDMNISGIKPDTVNRLRLWSSKASSDFDMALFSRGEYIKAMESKMMAESISKVLYPADDHYEGKSLRLKQQYFFVSASIQSIIKRHLLTNPTLDNLADRASIHINDTHPTLCIPELMRILLDEYRYGWDQAWQITCDTISYTNHTVMAEALETWPQQLFSTLLPRIYQIVCEINRRYCDELWTVYPNNHSKVAENAILEHNQVKMATMCLVVAHTVNGVSALHSEILKKDIFKDYYQMHPNKFTNVTNGITHRRWLEQANPDLAALITESIGDKWIKDATQLKKLEKFATDKAFLEKLAAVKRLNKIRLADYIGKTTGIVVNPDSVFDCQAKRLHEYKRQLLNAFNILDLYYRLKENPSLDIAPRTFIFGAKAASSYFMAKQIIRLIWQLGEVINNDKTVNDKIKVVFLENYRVSLAEIMIPATEISEQISVAGKEASGTGNMKFMLNGAVTIGTMDGANVEIHEAVGAENIFIFGLLTEQVNELYRNGYNASSYYMSDARIKRIIDNLRSGIGDVRFTEIADSLILGNNSIADPYMVLADFASYVEAQNRVNDTYADKTKFNAMALKNIANAGFFSADRAVREYAERIWNVKPVN